MKYAENYLRSAAAIITAYNGDTPFAGFLKTHFAANKKFGSKIEDLFPKFVILTLEQAILWLELIWN